MTRKCFVASGFLGLGLFLCALSPTHADWEISLPPDGTYTLPKAVMLSVHGYGENDQVAWVQIHARNDQDQEWGQGQEDGVGGQNPNEVWEFTSGIFSPDGDGDNRFPPFFDHDINPETELVWPPNAEGDVALYSQINASRAHVEDHWFTVGN